jgi:glycosyltransferase involved in cell wall biosynthesis
MTAEHPDGDRHDSVKPRRQVRPRLAVLIPVLNDQEGLERSLDSLAREEFNFDVFVVDDGSDPPISIPADLPYRVQLVQQTPNQGITSALNRGLAAIAEVGYEYVARLDAGDLSLPGRFAAQISFLETHPEHALVGAATQYVDSHGNFLFDYRPPTEHKSIMRFLRYRAAIVHPSIMVRTSALVACGLYRDKFARGEDYDLFMRLGQIYRLANLDATYVVMVITPDSLSSKRQQIIISRLQLLAWYFDFWSIHSYLGMAANVLGFLLPRPLVLRFRQLGGSIRGLLEALLRPNRYLAARRQTRLFGRSPDQLPPVRGRHERQPSPRD